jgi:hypothetical protein
MCYFIGVAPHVFDCDAGQVVILQQHLLSVSVLGLDMTYRLKFAAFPSRWRTCGLSCIALDGRVRGLTFCNVIL